MLQMDINVLSKMARVCLFIKLPINYTSDGVLSFKNWLEKDREVQNHYEFLREGLAIYPSLEAKKTHCPEFILSYGSKPRPSKPKRTLKGLRIAIDPGHI